MRLWVAVAIAVISVTGCGETAESPELLTQVVQLAGAESGTELVQWEPQPDRAIVVYSVRGCAEPQCETSLATLHAVGERGEPWFIAILEEGAIFEIGEDASEVSVLSADRGSTRYAVENPAPTVALSEGDQPVAQFG